MYIYIYIYIYIYNRGRLTSVSVAEGLPRVEKTRRAHRCPDVQVSAGQPAGQLIGFIGWTDGQQSRAGEAGEAGQEGSPCQSAGRPGSRAARQRASQGHRHDHYANEWKSDKLTSDVNSLETAPPAITSAEGGLDASLRALADVRRIVCQVTAKNTWVSAQSGSQTCSSSGTWNERSSYVSYDVALCISPCRTMSFMALLRLSESLWNQDSLLHPLCANDHAQPWYISCMYVYIYIYIYVLCIYYVYIYIYMYI